MGGKSARARWTGQEGETPGQGLFAARKFDGKSNGKSPERSSSSASDLHGKTRNNSRNSVARHGA